MFHYYTIVSFGCLGALTNEDDSTPLPPTDNLPCHFVSAFGAGFVTTVIASPVDVVKTRYMNSPPGQYRSAINCAWTMMTKEGPTAFYKGWVRPIGHLWTSIKKKILNHRLRFALQICAIVSEAGVVEHRHVCLLRTNQESHDGHKKEDRSQKLRFPQYSV